MVFTHGLTSDEAEQNVAMAKTAYKRLKDIRVLIVDDCEAAQRILCEQLEHLEALPSVADSGVHALACLKEQTSSSSKKPFDFIVIDSSLPDMQGEELARSIRTNQEWDNIPLIMASNSPSRGDGNRLGAVGFAGYLTKPLYPSELATVLSLIMQGRHAEEEYGMVTRHSFKKSRGRRTEILNVEDVHILLAEDNEVNRMVATSILKRFGCTVTPAGNGVEVLKLFDSRDFSLILMDCLMPDMDGFSATKRIREKEEEIGIGHLPIVAFTANVLEGDRERCLNAGMDDYLTKPAQIGDVEQILSKWLPNHVVRDKNKEEPDPTVDVKKLN